MAGIVRVFRPDFGKDLTESEQGQSLVPLWHGGLEGNMPDSPTCGVGIVMPPGKASTPHIHHEVQVHVTLTNGYPVLTLAGYGLEQAVWLANGESLVIQPGVPHVALYPRQSDDIPALDAVAVEVRNTPYWTYDVEPLPELWPLAALRAEEIGIKHLISWPNTL